MTLKLNVLITVTDEGRIFSVWSDNLKELPWISQFEGHGENISSAVDDYFLHLPDNIVVDDEIIIRSCDIKYSLKRPFKVTRNQGIRIFKVS